jgi:integrase
VRRQLTDLSVRQLKAAEKQYKVWDAKTPGFGIVVGSTTKSWFAVYGRARKFKALGRYPELSLADARTAAKKLLLERSDRAASKAFGEALDLYKVTHLSTLRKSSSYALTTLMERHYRSWAAKDLEDITGAEIVRYLDTLLDTPTERYKAFKELRAFFRWCMGRQYMHANPCAALRAPETPKSRDRVLTDDELVAVWRAGEAMSGNFSKIIRLLILTGMRRGECSKLRGEYIARDKQVITLPGSITKNGNEHLVYYGPMTAAILPATQIGWLFPAMGRPKNAFNGFAQPKQVVVSNSGVSFSLHDLRRTFSTKLAEQRVYPHIIERLLNHIRGDLSPVAHIYNRHTYADECRAALELWESHLISLLSRSRTTVTVPA